MVLKKKIEESRKMRHAFQLFDFFVLVFCLIVFVFVFPGRISSLQKEGECNLLVNSIPSIKFR